MTRLLTTLLLVAGFVMGQENPSAQPAATPPAPASPTPEPAATAAPATPAPVTADTAKAIPQAYSEEHYASTWNRNPFLIETANKATGPQAPPFSEDWELKGLIRKKGLPEALLGNKKTQEYHWVTTIEDKDGLTLIKANIDRDLHKSSVEVAKAGEAAHATFTFPEVASAPAAGTRPGMPMQPGGAPGRGGVPNNNAIRPGMNNGVMPQPGAGGAVPRMNPANPAIKPNGAIPNGGAPNVPTRRRVLIPPSAPAS